MRSTPFYFLPVILLSACATRSDLASVQGEVVRLKEESKTIKTQSAGSYSELTQFREELASLKGSIEELRYHNGKAIKRLDIEDSLSVRKSDAIEARLSRLEQYIGIAEITKGELPVAASRQQEGTPSSPDESLAPAPDGQAVPSGKVVAADNLLKEGLLKMKKGDYKGARDNFTSFLAKNTKSEQAGDAQFYIAESYFNEKMYEKAILEYQIVIAKYLKNAKRPAALYKQALSFEKIGDASSAKERLKDVIKVYPSSPEAKLAKKKLK